MVKFCAYSEALSVLYITFRSKLSRGKPPEQKFFGTKERLNR